MAKQDRTTLKSYFETGDIPTQAQFIDLIDSNFNLDEDYLVIEAALAQLDTDIAIATAISNFPITEDMAFVSAFINVSIAPVGSDAVYDININGATALSTKITIEAGETSSLTAANQPVFSTASATKGQQATIDCDQIGASTAGQNPVLVIIYKKN